jgi:hypothetical protein
MFINSNKRRSRRTSTSIHFVLLSVQQMLKLATLGLRTRHGTSANQWRSSSQPIVSILCTAAASKCDWAVQLVQLFTGTPDISCVPTDRNCGFAVLDVWMAYVVDHHDRSTNHDSGYIFSETLKCWCIPFCLSIQLNRVDSSVQGHVCTCQLALLQISMAP